MRSIIQLPNEIKIVPNKFYICIYGPFGFNSLKVIDGVQMELKIHSLVLKSTPKTKLNKANFGLFFSLLKNNIKGVITKFIKILKISGSGYKFVLNNSTLFVNAGQTKLLFVLIPKDIELKLIDNSRINISSTNKHLVGEIASKIRNVRPIEPYKLRGISYLDENPFPKEGKKRK